MKWKDLNSISDLDTIDVLSQKSPVIIFKHSTRCSISDIAWSRLHNTSDNFLINEDVQLYYLDIITYRHISNTIAEKYKVYHESPQLLIIQNGECIYDASHLDIRWTEISEQLDIAISA